MPFPTGVCTAQCHLDAIAVLDQQLAVLTPAELLLEETESEWNPAGPSPELLLPRLQNWRQCNSDPFQGSLVRG